MVDVVAFVGACGQALKMAESELDEKDDES